MIGARRERARDSLRLGAAGLSVAVTALLLLAPAAGTTILPQRGIMGIELDMTRGDVVRTVGQPDAEKTLPHPIIGVQRMLRYGQTRAYLGPVSNEVLSVTTRDPDELTPSGVGVGSTVAELRARVGGLSCRSEYGVRHCWKGRFRAGQRVTDFTIEDGRVGVVTIAVVLD